ncbi:transcription elongation factor S-II [Aphanomyces invadans]|uniref:Transcription elongation factor S-II n=1 Tax=Aphanomyces invadans TaxID=157072 RepID=A0A024TW44_9STRA|nr:transcription elongation factor S-II [Aphanomyces invadans]ETV98360.1 transcription elongation factor S-II [Aphanomyces invadans]RHY26166.1 hypothetical protein DYB32_007839 [Aphanomyces invadans]|eukprot:XP_008873235.1 transcription elongation factor S-II [Aphanomyces invadans]
MDDVVNLHKRLTKFLAGDDNDQNGVADAMDHLNKVDMTLAILKDTKIGQTIAKLRKHDAELVSSKAKILLKKWKTLASRPSDSDIKVEADGKSEPGTPGPKVSPTTSDGSLKDEAKWPEKDETAPAITIRRPSMHALASQRGSTPFEFIPKGLQDVRATVRRKLKEVLCLAEAPDLVGEAELVAVAIEVAMAREYNMDSARNTNEGKKHYTDKYRQLSFNLKKNVNLRLNLLTNKVTGDQLIKMTPDEMATDERRKEMDQLRDDAFQRARLDWAEANADKINKACGIKDARGLFTCGRCKSTKTSNTQQQTRSADEPMTVFVICHDCGKRWKC